MSKPYDATMKGLGADHPSEDSDEAEEGETIELSTPPETTRRRVGKIKLTSQDQKFLRALKISVDEEGR